MHDIIQGAASLGVQKRASNLAVKSTPSTPSISQPVEQPICISFAARIGILIETHLAYVNTLDAMHLSYCLRSQCVKNLHLLINFDCHVSGRSQLRRKINVFLKGNRFDARLDSDSF
jgi:hypothetical protein